MPAFSLGSIGGCVSGTPCGCGGCTPCASCVSCADGGPYGREITITDFSGDHVAVWSDTDFKPHVPGSPGGWWAFYTTDFTYPDGSVDCNPGTETFYIWYAIKCVDGSLVAFRFWLVGFESCCVGSAIAGSYGTAAQQSEPIAPCEPCDPALTADFTDATWSHDELGPYYNCAWPVDPTLTVSIPKLGEGETCFPVPCTPCDLDAVNLCLISDNSAIGSGFATLTYNSGTHHWTYDTGASVPYTSSTNYASTCADGGGGSFAWTNSGNAKVNDGVFATAISFTAQLTNYLRWTNFGFAIPGNLIIQGIKAEIAAKGNSFIDRNIYLTKDGSTVVGSNLDGTNTLTGTLTVYTYGGSSNLWGTTWLPAEINATTFGLMAQWSYAAFPAATISVDYARVTIYAASLAWTATLSCDGGTVSLTVTSADDTAVMSVSTYDCDPLDLEFVPTGGIATDEFFTSFSVRSDCGATSGCVPCELPKTGLTISWTGPVGAGSATMTYVFAGTDTWGTYTCENYGTPTTLAFGIECDSLGTILSIEGGNASCMNDGTAGYFFASSTTGELSASTSSCTPLSLTYTVTNPSTLYTLGFRTFVVTL